TAEHRLEARRETRGRQPARPGERRIEGLPFRRASVTEDRYGFAPGGREIGRRQRAERGTGRGEAIEEGGRVAARERL
ncbi:MAG TPA: hypothetical protein VGE98_08940, partial [Thermoanaerobaculia bacterium]